MCGDPKRYISLNVNKISVSLCTRELLTGDGNLVDPENTSFIFIKSLLDSEVSCHVTLPLSSLTLGEVVKYITERRAYSQSVLYLYLSPNSLFIKLNRCIQCHYTTPQCCNESQVIDSDSSRNFLRLNPNMKNDSTRVNSPKWLVSDLTCWFLP